MRATELPNAVAGARRRSRPINLQWLSGPCRELAATFAGIADAEAVADRAATLLADDAWTMRLLDPLINALRADPWFEPGLRVSRDALRTATVLLDIEALSITATVIHAASLAALPPATSVVIPGRFAITRYARGDGAVMRRWRSVPVASDFSAADAPPAFELPPVTVQDGMIMRHDGRTYGHIIVNAPADVVTLTATIKANAAPLMREYAMADGRFLRAASADELASRTEMLLTFLRVSGRADAGAAFAAASHHPAFHLRWAAMREWLMLDAAGARARLAELAAQDDNAEVRIAASATLAALDQRIATACHA